MPHNLHSVHFAVIKYKLHVYNVFYYIMLSTMGNINIAISCITGHLHFMRSGAKHGIAYFNRQSLLFSSCLKLVLRAFAA